ncbi:MAG: S49 family peptidase [Desulfobacterales bacterium]|nr:S49 family peptidase [Desulfobacterales bacterium]
MQRNNHTILAEPWAITKEALESVCHELKSQPVSVAGDLSDRPDLTVKDHIAVIPVQSALYRFSYDRIRSQVQAALDDGSVRAMVLKINSPGGLVAGCKELADFIRDAGNVKHIYAYADGTMCSAAYWIGSAAHMIAAPLTAGIGSIGVRMLHVDWSKWNENTGLSFTHLAAGSYKVLGNEDEPLDKKARDYFQSHLDTLYSVFVDSIAGYQGVDTDTVLAMADGRVFLGQDALEQGLIHRIEQDFESYFSFILQKEKIMDLTSFKADHPALYTQVFDKGKAAAQAEAKEKIKTAVTDETRRVLGIAGAVAGEETAERLKTLVASGASVEMVTAMKETFAPQAAESDEEDVSDTTSRQQILDALHQSHSKGLNQQVEANKPGEQSLDKQAGSFSDLVND